MEKKTIGSFLSALRKASGLTQKQLADKLNVSDKAVSRWERDECAPDLSLIPVLAEIYGVTSDEILRGKRNDPEGNLSKADPIKAELQRKNLLKSTLSRFHIRSIGCGFIALVGLLIIYILNLEFAQASAGLLIGSIFFLSAIVGQLMSFLSALASIRGEEWICNDISDVKESMLLLTEAIISITALVFAWHIPLLGQSKVTVPLIDCLTGGIRYVLISAIICFVVSSGINCVFFSRTRSASRRLRLTCTSILSVAMISLLLGNTFMNASLTNNRHTYASCQEFTDAQSFKVYMANRLSREGYPINFSPMEVGNDVVYQCEVDFTGETFTLPETDIVRRLIPSDEPIQESKNSFYKEYGYQYEHWNLNVVHCEFTDGDDPFPIYTFTLDEFEASNQIILMRNAQYALLYILPIAVISIIYLILRKRTA